MSDSRRFSFVAVGIALTLLSLGSGGASPVRADGPALSPQQSTTQDSTVLVLPLSDTVAAQQKNRSKEARWGGQVGGFAAPLSSPRPYDEGWAIMGATYRLQPAGKRTLFQPDLYTDLVTTYGRPKYDGSSDTPELGDLRHGRLFWGIGVSERATLYLMKTTLSFYGGAGGGIYHLQTFRTYRRYTNDLNNSDGYTGELALNMRTERIGFHTGYKAFAGLNHRKGFYLEVGWQDAGRMDGLAFRGVSYSLGFRR